MASAQPGRAAKRGGVAVALEVAEDPPALFRACRAQTRLRRGALRAKPPVRVHDAGAVFAAERRWRTRLSWVNDIEEGEHVMRDPLLGPALLTLVE